MANDKKPQKRQVEQLTIEEKWEKAGFEIREATEEDLAIVEWYKQQKEKG